MCYRAYLDFMRKSKPDLFPARNLQNSNAPFSPSAADVDDNRFLGRDFDQRAMEPEEVIGHWDTARAAKGNGNGKSKNNKVCACVLFFSSF
jgi:hypothetical protein